MRENTDQSNSSMDAIYTVSIIMLESTSQINPHSDIFFAMLYFSQADNIPYRLLIFVTKDLKISKTTPVYFM